MQIRRYEHITDYETLCLWWKAWRFQPLHPAFLSSTGFVAEKDGKPCGMVFVYMSDSAVCWMEWLTTSPFITKADRQECLKSLLDEVKAWSIEHKFLAILTSTVHATLKKVFPENGFVKSEENVSHFMWLGGLNGSSD